MFSLAKKRYLGFKLIMSDALNKILLDFDSSLCYDAF